MGSGSKPNVYYFSNLPGINVFVPDVYKRQVQATAVEMQKTACALELAYGKTNGTMRVLDKFFAGQWDGEFCVIAPGETVAEKHFEDRPRCVEAIDDGSVE